MFLASLNDRNLEITNRQINKTLTYLRANQPGFCKLSPEAQLRLAMQHYQCERGRLQKGKNYLDILLRFGPIIVAALAILFAVKK
jgi:hypothetical protein